MAKIPGPNAKIIARNLPKNDFFDADIIF